jgi:hypothetical protein
MWELPPRESFDDQGVIGSFEARWLCLSIHAKPPRVFQGTTRTIIFFTSYVKIEVGSRSTFSRKFQFGPAF